MNFKEKFLNDVLARDKEICFFCKGKATTVQHIFKQDTVIFGGFVKENGIAVCQTCKSASDYTRDHLVKMFPVWNEDEILAKVGSTAEMIHELSAKLKPRKPFTEKPDKVISLSNEERLALIKLLKDRPGGDNKVFYNNLLNKLG